MKCGGSIALVGARKTAFSILGVNISATSYETVVETCSRWIIEHRHSPATAKYICVTSVHGVMMAQKDPHLRSVINRAHFATPDGMPLVWALRSFGARQQRRVYGPNLMLALCERAASCGHRVFIYGSTSERLAQLERRLRCLYPGLQIVGSRSDLFRPSTESEKAEFCNAIRESRCDLLFVGLGETEQNRWMAANRGSLPGIVMVGLGAAFDFHVRPVRQAPECMQNSGLEWLFRLIQEPKRLAKRYLLITPPLLPLWAMQWIHPRGLLNVKCTKCRSNNVRPSSRPKVSDLFNWVLGQRAYQCRDCRSRFLARAPDFPSKFERTLADPPRRIPFTLRFSTTRGLRKGGPLERSLIAILGALESFRSSKNRHAPDLVAPRDFS